MQTIRLRVNEKIYNNLMWLLSRFNREEIQIIEENEDYIAVKEYLEKELEKIDKDQTNFITLDELDSELEKRISKYEN